MSQNANNQRRPAISRLKPDRDTRSTAGYAVLIEPILRKHLEQVEEMLSSIEVTTPLHTRLHYGDPDAETASVALMQLTNRFVRLSMLIRRCTNNMQAEITPVPDAPGRPDPAEAAMYDWPELEPADAETLDPNNPPEFTPAQLDAASAELDGRAVMGPDDI